MPRDSAEADSQSWRLWRKKPCLNSEVLLAGWNVCMDLYLQLYVVEIALPPFHQTSDLGLLYIHKVVVVAS